MSHLPALLLLALSLPARAALSEQALAELLATGGLLDQLVWVEEHLPTVTDPAEREAWHRIHAVMLAVSEELGTGALPQGWDDVLRVAADPPSEDTLRATVGAFLLGTVPEGRAAIPADRFREGRLVVLHPRFDYYAVEASTAGGSGLALTNTVVRERRFDRVLVCDGRGEDLDPGALRERLAAVPGWEKTSPRRLARDEDRLRAAVGDVNAAFARDLGLDAATVAAVEAGGAPVHWTELLPICPSWMPPLYPLFRSVSWTREIAASASEVPGLGEVCRVVPRRAAAPDPEP
jgi:hypothetical protein